MKRVGHRTGSSILAPSLGPNTTSIECIPCHPQTPTTVDTARVKAAGVTNFAAILSVARTDSTIGSLGLARYICDLHCGQSSCGGPKVLFRELGLSMSAIQSNKQSSCATSAHGQGDLHSELSAVSSVSSAKHIQHFFTSSSSCTGREARGVVCWLFEACA